MRTAFAPDRILEVRTRWEFDGAPADFGRLSDVVVVDCRAASTRIFLNYFDETEMPTVLEGINAGLSCPAADFVQRRALLRQTFTFIFRE